jgi:prepilin-type processing-associated H-X9-DG protein
MAIAQDGETVPQRRLTPRLIIGALLLAVVVAVLWGPNTYHVPVATIRAACIANLREQDQATLLYAGDHDGVGPPTAWMDALLPSLKDNEDLLHCPAAQKADRSAYGYVFNSELVGRQLTTVKKGATTPLIFDSTSTGRNAVGGIDTLPDPPRHGGTNSIAYADGHASSKRSGSGTER